MFLTNEKKKHSTWQGTFYTRKWNDITPVVYFEKLYGGKPLLKKINQFAIQENLTFNSSMIDESNAVVWQSAGWQVLEKLKVNGVEHSKIEGKDSSEWKLVDGIDLIVHIFHPEKRKFYELEKIWSELIPKEKLII